MGILAERAHSLDHSKSAVRHLHVRSDKFEYYFCQFNFPNSIDSVFEHLCFTWVSKQHNYIESDGIVGAPSQQKYLFLYTLGFRIIAVFP